MPFLALFGNRNLLIAVAAVAALVYVGWLNLSIYRLERDVARLQTSLEIARSNLEQALAINDANRDTLGKLTADARASTNAHAQALAAAQRRCEIATRIRTEMNRAIAETPSTCPLAPSVRAVLDGLWPDPARAAPGDQDRARGGVAAGGSADLPR
jgi:hypothetical protein